MYAAMEVVRSGLTALATPEGIAASVVPAALVGAAAGVTFEESVVEPGQSELPIGGRPAVLRPTRGLTCVEPGERSEHPVVCQHPVSLFQHHEPVE
jgi:hypothetical protein